MTDLQYFRPPFPGIANDTKHVRADEEDEEEQSGDGHEPGQGQLSSTDAVEEPLEEQPPNFPHAPLVTGARVSHSRRTRANNVKRHHVAVLNTLLHKWMLDGDYIRAGRAFSMLLRLEMGGLKIDLRKDGLWGIGAEILLRSSLTSSENSTKAWFSPDGFRAARAYYDRLILQYPHRKTHQHIVSSLHFNVAMFGVWIFQVQDRSQAQLQALERGSGPDEILDDLGISLSEIDKSSTPDVYRSIKEWELKQARTIQDHIEHITLVPPFDKDPQHLKLSGMISLWIMNLLRATSKPDADIKTEQKKAMSQFRLTKDNGGIVWKEAELATQPAEEDELVDDF